MIGIKISVTDILEVKCLRQRLKINKVRQHLKKIGFSMIHNPPKVLYHVTMDNEHTVNTIGLMPNRRIFVHLTDNLKVAQRIFERYKHYSGKVLFVYKIDTLTAKELGVHFYRVNSGVWLVRYIPATCLCL